MALLHHPVWSGWVNAEWLWAGEGSGSVVVGAASTPAFFAFSSWHWQSGRRRAGSGGTVTGLRGLCLQWAVMTNWPYKNIQ